MEKKVKPELPIGVPYASSITEFKQEWVYGIREIRIGDRIISKRCDKCDSLYEGNHCPTCRKNKINELLK